MPQTRLPYFPEDIPLINQHIGFVIPNADIKSGSFTYTLFLNATW